MKEHDNKFKKGLVLEGGAMRGMFTCGVMDVFLENGIEFDGAAGISAGATFGCNYKSKQPGRALRYNKIYGRDPRYCSFRSLIKTGDLYGADFCYRELPTVLDPFDCKTFKNNPMEFFVGATDIRTGKCVYHKCTDGGETDLKWMRASASMPLVSKPVSIDGYLLLDGGITDSIPFEYLENQGYDRNVIVLTQPDGFVKKKSGISGLAKIFLHGYPEVAGAMERRHEMYNDQTSKIKKRELDGTSFVIRPPKALGIKRTENDPAELERVYNIGRKTAEGSLEDVKRFLDA